MKKTIFILVAVFAIFISCNALVDYRDITLGENTWCIPRKYNTLDQSTGPVINIKGTDQGNYGGVFQVAINPPEVKKSIPGYFLKHGNLRASFIINVRQAPAGQSERSLGSKYYADTLQLTNDYKNSHVEYDEQNGFYRVSNFGFPPPFILWEVLSIKPDKKAILPNKLDDYYIASCSRAGGHNGTSSNCDYQLNIDGYLVKIITTENNLHLKEKITDYAKNLLVSWKKNCQ